MFAMEAQFGFDGSKVVYGGTLYWGYSVAVWEFA